MRRVVVVAALLCVLAWTVSSTETEALATNEVEFRAADLNRPMRESSRNDAHVGAFHNRAGLLFRALDQDKDQFLSQADLHSKGAAAAMAKHMPGVSIPTFLEFVASADKDGDNRLSRDELFRGLAQGLQEVHESQSQSEAEPAPQAAFVSVPAPKAQEPVSSGLLETEATVSVHKVHRRSASKHRRDVAQEEPQQEEEQEQEQEQDQDTSLLEADASAQSLTLDSSKTRRGFLGIGNLLNKGFQAVRGILGGINKNHDPCVLCQYIVERAENNIKQSGVLPGMASIGGTDNIFLETEVQVGQVNYDVQAAGIIGSTRQATRVQRQLERQKYNEIYRIVDLTLDDVCEQGFPPVFYDICKQVYKKQSDIVDGLRYQYRAGDICTRVGICSKTSYLTQGLHSRWKPQSLGKRLLNLI